MSALTLIDERELLIRIASDDEHSFEQLFNIYHSHLFTYVFRISESAELAEEIVQDVFLKLWINRQALAEVTNFKSYLFTVSKNHTLNCIKKIVKERLLKREVEPGIIESIPEESTETPLYFSLLDEAVNQLPPQQKKIYLMSRHERLKYAQIADELGLSKETVKKYLQIATASITTYVRENMKRLAGFLFFL